eukprot:14241-Pelagococcus_subviridis.AAC.1
MHAGSFSISLSLKMSHPSDGGRHPSGTSLTRLALKLSMNSDFMRPSTTGTATNSHRRKNSTRRFTSPSKDSGSDDSGLSPRFKNSSDVSAPIFSGSRARSHPDRSSLVTPLFASEPSSMAASTRVFRASGVSPSCSAASLFAMSRWTIDFDGDGDGVGIASARSDGWFACSTKRGEARVLGAFYTKVFHPSPGFNI